MVPLRSLEAAREHTTIPTDLPMIFSGSNLCHPYLKERNRRIEIGIGKLPCQRV